MLSLSCTEGSADFEIVRNLSSLGTSSERHIGLGSVFAHNLHVDITDVVNRERFTFLGVKQAAAILHNFAHAITN